MWTSEALAPLSHLDCMRQGADPGQEERVPNDTRVHCITPEEPGHHQTQISGLAAAFLKGVSGHIWTCVLRRVLLPAS